MTFLSYAQNFEDVLLWRALGNIEAGFYIDIGAQDPIIDSVSRGFYEKGWRGIHIEATHHYAGLVRANRPDEIVIEAAVSDQPGMMTFFEIPGSGLSTGDRAIAENHRLNGFEVKELIVPRVLLADVFDQVGEREIHWMKIDVEGMEGQVLSGWGDAAARPWVLVLESTYPTSQIPTHEQWEPLVLSRDYSFAFFDGLSRYYVSAAHPELLPVLSTPANVFDQIRLFSGHAISSVAVTEITEQLAEQNAQIAVLEKTFEVREHELLSELANVQSVAAAEMAGHLAAQAAETTGLLAAQEALTLAVARSHQEALALQAKGFDESRAVAEANLAILEEGFKQSLAAEHQRTVNEIAALEAHHAVVVASLEQALADESLRSSEDRAAKQAEIGILVEEFHQNIAVERQRAAEEIAALKAHHAATLASLEKTLAEEAALRGDDRAVAQEQLANLEQHFLSSIAADHQRAAAYVAQMEYELNDLQTALNEEKRRRGEDLAATEMASKIMEEELRQRLTEVRDQAAAQRANDRADYGAQLAAVEAALLTEQLRRESDRQAAEVTVRRLEAEFREAFAAAHQRNGDYIAHLEKQHFEELAAWQSRIDATAAALGLELTDARNGLEAARTLWDTERQNREEAFQAHLVKERADFEQCLADQRDDYVQQMGVLENLLAQMRVDHAERERQLIDRLNASQIAGAAQEQANAARIDAMSATAAAERTIWHDHLAAAQQMAAKLHDQKLQSEALHTEYISVAEARLHAAAQKFSHIERQLQLEIRRQNATGVQLHALLSEILADRSWRFGRKIAHVFSSRRVRSAIDSTIEDLPIVPEPIYSFSPDNDPDIDATDQLSKTAEPARAQSMTFDPQIHDLTPPSGTIMSFTPSGTSAGVNTLAEQEDCTPASSVAELLECQDRQFVHKAYWTILGRAPDENGLNYFILRLRNGAHKLLLIRQMRRSAEGRVFGAEVLGLNKALRTYRIGEIPMLGPMLLRLIGAHRDGSVGNGLRRVESQIHLLSEQIANISATNSRLAAEMQSNKFVTHRVVETIEQNRAILSGVNRVTQMVDTCRLTIEQIQQRNREQDRRVERIDVKLDAIQPLVRDVNTRMEQNISSFDRLGSAVYSIHDAQNRINNQLEALNAVIQIPANATASTDGLEIENEGLTATGLKIYRRLNVNY